MQYRNFIAAFVVFCTTAKSAIAVPNIPFFAQVVQTGQDAITIARTLQIAWTRGQPSSPNRDEHWTNKTLVARQEPLDSQLVDNSNA
jgi:hypothetical protein